MEGSADTHTCMRRATALELKDLYTYFRGTGRESDVVCVCVCVTLIDVDEMWMTMDVLDGLVSCRVIDWSILLD